MKLRPIEPGDDAQVASLIRTVMPEFGAVGPGFAIEDPEVDGMFAAYDRPGAGYVVVVQDGSVVGGGGFAPLEGGPDGVCELRKMYFLAEIRGLGLGARLLDRVLGSARSAGYVTCYLETLEGMHQAQRLYERFGFSRLPGPWGATGHTGCNRWYSRPL